MPSNNSPSSLQPEALQRYLQAPISLIDRVISEKRAEEEQAKIARNFEKLRRQQTGRGGDGRSGLTYVRVLDREVPPPISMHKKPALNLKTHWLLNAVFGCAGLDLS